jgi:hypothetical protein
MASIVGKKQGGKTYYYLVESARVGGKPRIVSQRYLGSADEIAQRLSESGPGEPDRTRHLSFGDLAAVWGMLARLGVSEIVDAVVGDRRSDAAGSVGTYFALSVANRVVAPCSKLAFADWWATTCGDRLVKLPASGGDGRRLRRRADRDRASDRRAHGGLVRSRLLGPGARHDQLRHLHRFGQCPGADRSAGSRQAEADRPVNRTTRHVLPGQRLAGRWWMGYGARPWSLPTTENSGISIY